MSALYPPILESQGESVASYKPGDPRVDLVIPITLPMSTSVAAVQAGHIQVLIRRQIDMMAWVEPGMANTPEKEIIYLDGTALNADGDRVTVPFNLVKAFLAGDNLGADKASQSGRIYTIQVRFGDSKLWIALAQDFAPWKASQIANSLFGEWSNTQRKFCYGVPDRGQIFTVNIANDIVAALEWQYSPISQDPIAQVRLTYSWSMPDGQRFIAKNLGFLSQDSMSSGAYNRVDLNVMRFMPITVTLILTTINGSVFSPGPIQIPSIGASAVDFPIDPNGDNSIQCYPIVGEELEDGILAMSVSGILRNRTAVHPTEGVEYKVYRVNVDTEEVILLQTIRGALLDNFSIIIKDYSVEMGAEYAYIAASYGLITKKVHYILTPLNGLYPDTWNPPMNPGYGRQMDFNSNIFLTTMNQQLRLQGNVNVSTFQRNTSDQITQTIGSEFPFYSRAAKTNYRTLSLQGLITLNFDTTHTFLKFISQEDPNVKIAKQRIASDYQIAVANIPRNDPNYSSKVKGLENVYYSKLKLIYEGINPQPIPAGQPAELPIDWTSGQLWFVNNEDSKDIILRNTDLFSQDEIYLNRKRVQNRLNSANEKIDSLDNTDGYYYDDGGVLHAETDRVRGATTVFDSHTLQDITPITNTSSESHSIYAERKFRDSVMSWLSDGRPKLLRSETEGNMIVMLSGISFSPFNKSRKVYNVSATVTEIAEYNLENLILYGLVPTSIFYVDQPPAPFVDYFTLTSDTNMTIIPKWTNSGTMEYSVDDSNTWLEATSGVATSSAKAIKFRGNMDTNSLYAGTDSANAWKITNGTNVIASGDITTLLKPEGKIDKLEDYAFSYMFADCTSLITAPKLSATTLAEYCYYYMFSNCTSLTTAPELPAMNLAESCYSNMFSKCTSLTTAPELLATTLVDSCYQFIFNGCTSLTIAPELPATTLADSCYESMFYNCTSLTTAPELPATTLANSCYSNMFIDCTSLTTAQELPATTLAKYCYSNMFGNCTSLTTAPELPAMNLATYCYYHMFSNCTSLTTAPELPAMNLATSCYKDMFNDCTSLTTAPELPATTLANDCYESMFTSCTALKYPPRMSILTELYNSFEKMFDLASADLFSLTKTEGYQMEVTNSTNGIIPSFCHLGNFAKDTTIYGKTPWVPKYFTLTSDTNMTVTPKWTNSGTMEYSIDGGNTWLEAISGAATTSAKGVKFRGNMATNSLYTDRTSINAWKIINGTNVVASGDITTLLKPEGKVDKLDDYAFYGMFSNCTSLITAPGLPATTLARYCYSYMFNNCTSLTIAPELPAMTLADGCYQSMFYDCTALTMAPELPAIILFELCYRNMFAKCISLTTGPNLPAMSLSKSCYSDMFSNCTSLITAPKLFAIALSEDCCARMFKNCTSLTVVPELPATILANSCYNNMFIDCISLITAPTLPATTLASNCYIAMFEGCTSLVDAPKLSATILDQGCYFQMFKDCTSLTTPPELPATILTINCYNQMFKGCISLTIAPSLPATILSSSGYIYMFEGCISLTYPPEMSTLTVSDNFKGMFFNAATDLFSLTKTDNYQMEVTNSSSESIRSFCHLGDFAKDTTIYGKTPFVPNYFTLTFDTDMTVTPKWTNSGTMEYSIDNGVTWRPATSGTATSSAKVIKFRGNMATNSLYTGLDLVNAWKITDGVNVIASGDITTLLKPEGKIDRLDLYAFSYMFNGCSSLTIAPELPATTLADSCYEDMFNNCISLTTAPELPAMTLADSCYGGMFSGCTSLTTAPELPATTLANGCYLNMFNTCTSLTTAPKLPATTLAISCYLNMFVRCTSLTTAPELPATTLVISCYSSMFTSCTALKYPPRMSILTGSYRCFERMFNRASADLFSLTKIGDYQMEVTNSTDNAITLFCHLGDFAKNTIIYGKSK